MIPEDKHLHDLARSVETEADFLHFAQALLADWRDEEEKKKLRPTKDGESRPNGWENGTIGTFLEAMIAWKEDSRREFNDSPSWKLFALMLLAGSRYE